MCIFNVLFVLKVLYYYIADYVNLVPKLILLNKLDLLKCSRNKTHLYVRDLLLLLLLSHFSRVGLCATPWTAAYQTPPSLGFSRKEHGSGLPFPSPMHESEKWKWSHSVMSDSSWPHGLQPLRLLHLWEFPGKSTEVEIYIVFLSFVF